MNGRAIFALTLGGAALITLAACGSSRSGAEQLPPVPSIAPPSIAYSLPDLASTEPSVAVPSSSVAPVQSFPSGYPKVVAVKSLPDQVENWYQLSDYTKAVAVAPGVWTPLPPGATVQDAVASETLDGFCASIKAYERKYLDGEDEAGTCW